MILDSKFNCDWGASLGAAVGVLGLVTSVANRMRLLQARRKCPLEELAMEAARGLTG